MAERTRQADSLNVFLSYSREDLAFADQLDAALRLYGYATALDRHEISAGEDWKDRLGNLIRDADTVVFVLSPSSSKSDVCAWEVDEAIRFGKRIIPVVCRPLEQTTPPKQVADLNFVFFSAQPEIPDAGFGTGLTRLVEALKTNFDWLREHTRLLSRAREWELGNKAQNRLLSGSDILAAKEWIATRPKDAPAPTALHLDFIRASEEDEGRRHSAEAQRLRQMAEAQAAREAALTDKEKAQKSEAEAIRREAAASRRAAEESGRAAQASQRVAQRTRVGLAVSLALAIVAGGFGTYAFQQKGEAQAQGKEALKQKEEADIRKTEAEAATRVATAAKQQAVDALQNLKTSNEQLATANKSLATANELAEARRKAAEEATKAATDAEQRAVEAAKLLTVSNTELTASKLLAEARREAAEKALDLMLQQLVIKATFESVREQKPFRMAQVNAKERDDEFQQALRLAPDPDVIWTRLARVLIEFAERPPHQMRGLRKEREWAEHALLIIVSVIRRQNSVDARALEQRITEVLRRQ